MTKTTSPAPGRPRDSGSDKAILDSAITLLSEKGYAGLSFDGVAKLSGTTRPTVYRRYANKAELVVAAVKQAFSQSNPVVPNTGSGKKDVIQLLSNTVNMISNTSVGPVLRNLLVEIPRDKELAAMGSRLEKDRRLLLKEALSNGVKSGEFREITDFDVTAEMLLGAIYFRFLVTQLPISKSYLQKLVDQL